MSLIDGPSPVGPESRPANHGRLLAALRFADIRVLWLSTLSNQFGMGMQQVGLGWLVFELTGSGGMVGAIFAVRSAPNLVVGLAAGSITDRVDRRTLMRVSVWGMTAIASAVALLLFTGSLTVWQLMLFTFLLGTLLHHPQMKTDQRNYKDWFVPVTSSGLPIPAKIGVFLK